MIYFFLRDHESRRRSLPSLVIWALTCAVTLLGVPLYVIILAHLCAIEATFRANLWLAQHWQDRVFTAYGAERLFQTSDMRDSGANGKIVFFLTTIYFPISDVQDAVIAELSMWDCVLGLIAYLVAYGTLNLLVFHKLLDTGALSQPHALAEDDAIDG